jgi:hypothetical protein
MNDDTKMNQDDFSFGEFNQSENMNSDLSLSSKPEEDKDNPKELLILFQLDDSHDLNSLDSLSNESENTTDDNIILFPLDDFDVSSISNSTRTTPSNSNSQQKASSTKTNNPSRNNFVQNKNGNTSWKSKNRNSIPLPKPATKTKKSINNWKIFIVLFLILFIYFKRNYVYSNLIHPIGIWIVQHNPIGINLNDFERFKKGKPIFFAETPYTDHTGLSRIINRKNRYTGELILLGKTAVVNRRYILPRGTQLEYYFRKENKYEITIRKTFVESVDNYVDRERFFSVEKLLNENIDLSQKVLLQKWEGFLTGDYFFVPLNDLEYYDEVAVKCIKNDFNRFKKFDTGIIYLPTYFYELIQKGINVRNLKLKDIPLKKLDNNENKLKNEQGDLLNSEVYFNEEEVFPKIDTGASYQVKMKIFNGKSFFYKTPSDRYKRKEYISNWDFVTIERIEYGFGFAYFYNNEDDVIKEGGWLDMSSLEFRGNR